MLRMYQELIKFRSLLTALIVRHLAMRYRGSVLGFLWSFLNPLCLMLVYTLVFKYYIRFEQVENYTVFLFVGLLPWLWFSSALMEGTASIVSGGHLITKSMFPAHILPTVAVVTTGVNFLLSLPLLFLFMGAFGSPFHWTLLGLPLLFILQLLFLHGLVIGLSAINVRLRDTQHVLGNLLTFIFFLSPIIYPSSSVPDKFKFTLDLNPFALFTIAYQRMVIDGVCPELKIIVALIIFTVLVSVLGQWIFNHYREGFAELL